MHGVVIAMLKSSYIAELDADSTSGGRMARESVGAGKLTLWVENIKTEKLQEYNMCNNCTPLKLADAKEVLILTFSLLFHFLLCKSTSLHKFLVNAIFFQNESPKL